jgi:hypothetical protein
MSRFLNSLSGNRLYGKYRDGSEYRQQSAEEWMERL